MINTNKILDELLLPHAINYGYSSFGPEVQLQFICDDEHFLIINNLSDGYAIRNYFSNPQFVITEKRYHGFWKNILFRRDYTDKSFIEKHFDFVEFFGDISFSNFSQQKAKSRAIAFVNSFASQTISSKKITDISGIRSTISDFHSLIDNNTTDEHAIEVFVDTNPWILERSLGYKKYYSQITIDSSLLSRSDNKIRPDKFLERNDGYCDILDLKRPDMKIIIKKRNRNHASAAVTEAESQVATYVEFCCEPLVRKYLKTKNIQILWPQGLVIIGRIDKKDKDIWEDIKKRSAIKLITYDDLMQNLEELLNWFEEINKST